LAFSFTLFIGFATSAAALGAWLRDPLFADKAARLADRIEAHTENGRPPLTILMIGSSRTSNALRGADLEATLAAALNRQVVAFNFGVPSSGPVTQLLHLRRLLASGLRPDLVLFEIMPPLLAGQVPQPIEHHFYAPDRLLPGEADFVIAHGYPDDFRWRSLVSSLVPIYGCRLPILGRYLPAWSPWNMRSDSSRNCDETGWMRPVYDSVTPEQYRRGVDWARAEYSELLRTLMLQGPATTAVVESIELCRAAHLPIALILLPEGPDFRSMYDARASAELERKLDEWRQSTIDDRARRPTLVERRRLFRFPPHDF
jgi:hypothetical protein